MERTIEEYMQDYLNRGYVFMRTNDQWYPNFPNDMVAVGKFPLSNGKWRVCVWGADDCGMEIDVDTEEEMNHIFSLITEPVSKYDLTKLGFGPA